MIKKCSEKKGSGMFSESKVRLVFAFAFILSGIIAFLCGGIVVKAQELDEPLIVTLNDDPCIKDAAVDTGTSKPATAVVQQNPIVDFLKKIPGMRPGVMYNYSDSKVSFLSTVILAEKGVFAIEGGYSTSDDLVAIVSMKLVALKDLGIDLPILDLIEFRPGYAIGTSRIGSGGGNCEYVHGVTATLINIKW